MHDLTRRSWMKTGAAVVAAVPAIQGNAAAASTASQASSPDYLHAAQEAARWITGSAQTTPQGVHWLVEPDHPERAVAAPEQLGLYSGNAGVVLFLLQLAKATGDKAYLDQAKGGADFLANHWRDVADASSDGPLRSPFSFYSGLSGIGFSLTEVWKATGDVRFRDAALSVNEYFVKSAQPAKAGVTWTKTPSLGSGDTGVLLYLLYAASAFQDDSYRKLAVQAGDNILTLAQEDRRGGLRWQGVPAASLPGMPNDTYFPNFELGTAGVAYGLARLYSETKEARFLAAAKQGALHLQKIATIQGDSALVFYREPDKTDLYYLGFCHGPSGTGRLFYELYKVTNDHEYLEWTERLARGITSSGVPERLTPGFWYVVCQCCGSAGVTEFFLGLWAATHKTEYLAFAKRVADQMLSRVTDFNDAGDRWYQAWTRVTPWVVNAETGYMIGAAGEGTALLHVHLAERQRYEAILLPDNPFPRSIKA
jgi:rhamnogalacturonyl hydrolase YesR